MQLVSVSIPGSRAFPSASIFLCPAIELHGLAQSGPSPLRHAVNLTQCASNSVKRLCFGCGEPPVGPAHVQGSRFFRSLQLPSLFPAFFFSFSFLWFFAFVFFNVCPVFSGFVLIFLVRFSFRLFLFLLVLFLLLFTVCYIKSSPPITKMLTVYQENVSPYIMKNFTMHYKNIHCVQIGKTIFNLYKFQLQLQFTLGETRTKKEVGRE